MTLRDSLHTSTNFSCIIRFIFRYKSQKFDFFATLMNTNVPKSIGAGGGPNKSGGGFRKIFKNWLAGGRQLGT